jgi:hypothetical protein
VCVCVCVCFVLFLFFFDLAPSSSVRSILLCMFSVLVCLFFVLSSPVTLLSSFVDVHLAVLSCVMFPCRPRDVCLTSPWFGVSCAHALLAGVSSLLQKVAAINARKEADVSLIKIDQLIKEKEGEAQIALIENRVLTDHQK